MLESYLKTCGFLLAQDAMRSRWCQGVFRFEIHNLAPVRTLLLVSGSTSHSLLILKEWDEVAHPESVEYRYQMWVTVVRGSEGQPPNVSLRALGKTWRSVL